MKVLILGAAGSIGCHLTSQALARGHHVTALIRSGSSVPGGTGEGLHWVSGDARDPDVIDAAVRGQDAGEIKLGRWLPFRAEQVIDQDGSFVWAATVSMYGLPIRGSDSLVRGEGAMQWKLFDVGR